MSLKVDYKENGDVVYTTVELDMVDFIAFKHYGHHRKTAEAIYEANWGLADYGMLLPAGIEIILPTITQQPETKEYVKLWE